MQSTTCAVNRTASLEVGGVFIVAMAGMMATRSLWLPWFAGDNAIIATVTLFI